MICLQNYKRKASFPNVPVFFSGVFYKLTSTDAKPTAIKLWSSKSRSQTCLDYAES